MRLMHLDLVNACQFEKLAIDLPTGVIGIFGPNGCGKSNVMKLAKVSLTGDFKANPGIKTDNIRWGTPDNSVSRITAKWEHDGTAFTVVRGLQHQPDRLEVEGGNKYTGVTAVSGHVESLLNISKKLIEGFVFVDQWKMFEFLSDSPANRANTFTHLCGTQAAEHLWTLLGKQITTDSKLIVDVSESTENVEARIAEMGAKIAEAETKLAAQQECVLASLQRAKYEAVLADSRRADFLSTQLTDAETRLEAHLATRDSLDNEWSKANVAATQAEKLVRESQDEAAEARAQLLAEDENKEKRARRLKLEDVVHESPPTKPQKPADISMSLEEVTTEINAVQRNRLDAATRLEELEQDGVTACPTCSTPVAELEGKMDEWRAVVEAANKDLPKLKRTQTALRGYAGALRGYESDKANYDVKIAAAQAELDTLQDVQMEPLDVEAAENLVKRFKAMTTAKRTTADLLRECVTALVVFEKTQESIEEDISRYEKEYKSKLRTVEQIEVATDKLRIHNEAVTAIHYLSDQLDDYKEILQKAKEELKTIQSCGKRNTVLKQWIADMEAWRAVVHREMLPRIVAQKQLENMTTVMNKNLADFDGPFRVEAGQDLTFVAVKPSGVREQAIRLSGGEKVVLALAFRLAVNEVFAGDIGMMVLDEPTAGLDSENIDHLITVLEKLAKSVKANGHQIIFITHDARLERAFDKSIYLPDYIDGNAESD